jgi:hypothetical protein
MSGLDSSLVPGGSNAWVGLAIICLVIIVVVARKAGVK